MPKAIAGRRSMRRALVGLAFSVAAAMGVTGALTDYGEAAGPLRLASIYPQKTVPPAAADPNPVEVGTRFKVTVPGVVTGVRFHKSARNTGVHRVSLWSSDGRRLASARPGNLTRAGWQTVRFSRPVSIARGKVFVVSYHTRSGHYTAREGAYLGGSIGNRTVRGLAGVYRYGRSRFPRKTWHDSDYYVEPIFRRSLSRRTSSGSSASGSSSSAKLSTSPPSGWPNAQNTGATGSLTTVAGQTITTDGTTLANVMVNGQLTIKADDVTLRNVHVKTTGAYGVLTYGRNLVVEDSTIEGVVGTTAGLAAYEQGQFVARRLNVFNSEDGVRLSDNSKLYDSFIHDLIGTPEAHYDAVTADMYTGWEIVHNTILNQHDWTAAVWVGDPRYTASSGRLEDNFLAGGGYVVYGGPGTGPGIRVVDNVFSTRFFAKGGYWGPVVYWEPAGNTWSGNTWADGPSAGKPVAP
jgi:hypothetical protein